MKSIVTISIHFYYKGEKHSPSLTVELDEHMQTITDHSSFYPLLAKAHNYDLYSYEYEMMQAEPLTYSDAQGLVAEHIKNGELDLQAFKNAWQEKNILSQLQVVASNILQIDDLSKSPELEKALLEAYNLGQADATPEQIDDIYIP